MSLRTTGEAISFWIATLHFIPLAMTHTLTFRLFSIYTDYIILGIFFNVNRFPICWNYIFVPYKNQRPARRLPCGALIFPYMSSSPSKRGECGRLPQNGRSARREFTNGKRARVGCSFADKMPCYTRFARNKRLVL